MTTSSYAAVDFGAESGRAILGKVENEKHGLGPVIDAGIEIIRLKKTNSKINNNL